MKRVVIVDIDGTIARLGERKKFLEQKPKDWDAFYEDCFKDTPYDDMIELVNLLKEKYIIIFLTGRRDSVRAKTRLWLRKVFNIPRNTSPEFPILIMRPEGDCRHDTLVKPELLTSALGLGDFHSCNVLMILEDRNSMVKKWRELGYRCLQVQEGDF